MSSVRVWVNPRASESRSEAAGASRRAVRPTPWLKEAGGWAEAMLDASLLEPAAPGTDSPAGADILTPQVKLFVCLHRGKSRIRRVLVLVQTWITSDIVFGRGCAFLHVAAEAAGASAPSPRMGRKVIWCFCKDPHMMWMWCSVMRCCGSEPRANQTCQDKHIQLT